MAINWLQFIDKTHFIGNEEPADGRIQLGTLWSDANAGLLYICTQVSPVVFTLLVGGTGAPDGATYLTLSLNGTLTAERVLTAGTGIAFVDSGVNGTLTISATGTAATSFWPSLMLGGM